MSIFFLLEGWATADIGYSCMRDTESAHQALKDMMTESEDENSSTEKKGEIRRGPTSKAEKQSMETT